MNATGPYLSMKEAAVFCGYSPSTFRKMIKSYRVGRYGPKKNKFSQSELEAWMQDPQGVSDEQRITSVRNPKPLEV